MQNFKEFFKFSPKNTNSRPNEQNESNEIYGGDFVERYESKEECLDLNTPSTENATSISTHNKDLNDNVNESKKQIDQHKNNAMLKENSILPKNMYDQTFLKSYLDLKEELKSSREQLQNHKRKLETKDDEISNF
ncbi:10405_t:CDS:2, partial [Dentiscutata heterogama]